MRKMAHGALSENERLCLDAGAKNQTERSQDAEKPTNGDCKSNGLRVRFLDEEGKIERMLNADEANYNIKKIHLLRIRSASETSLLLRRPSLMEKRLNERRLSDGQSEMDCINRKSTCDNVSGRISSLMKINENDIPNKTDNIIDEAKDVSSQMFKKNCNVYSVNQAKTLTPEKKKIHPLAIPKLIGNKITQIDTIAEVKSTLPNEVFLTDGAPGKDFTARAIGRLSKGLGRLFRRTNSVRISEPDPTYKVAYLGNVVTGWARGESCTDKPLATLWRNYQQSTKPDVVMKLSVTNSGLKGLTKEHGLTEYWAHRITFCASPPNYPKVFCWVYRHEGKKLKHELRCHAALCTKEIISKKIADELKVKVKQALLEFKKDRISKQNARMSLANSVYDNPSMPRRKIMLSVGAMNYRPPLERSKSAPKLGAIEELCSEEDEEEAEMEAKQSLHDSWHPNSNSNSRTLDRRRPEMKSRKLSCPEGVLNRSLSDSDGEVQISTNLIDMIVNNMESKLQTLDKITELCEINDENDERKEIKNISQSNFLVTDSDDGSVSSGCETASTVTSSDAEPTSLPSQFPQEEIQKERPESDDEKVSEIPDFNLGSMRNDATLYSNSIHFMNLEIDPSKSLGVVSRIPIGEGNVFRRRSTYPPLGADTSILGLGNLEDKFESLIDNLGDIEGFESSTETYKNAGDNDSACSDESGYSEFLDNGKESIIGNTIMV